MGVLHEYIICTNKNYSCNFDNIEGNYHLVSGKSGARSNNPNKYRDDALILEKAYDEAANIKDDIMVRYSFYCAQSYKDAGNSAKAIEWYKKRISHDGWNQEVYYSYITIGQLYAEMNNIESAFYYWTLSFDADPERCEGIYYIVKRCRENGKFQLAYHYYKWIEKNKARNLLDKLFVTEDIYKYLLDYEFTIIACYAGQHKDAISSFHAIFKYANANAKNIPNALDVGLKENIVYNLQFYLDFIECADENLPFFYDYTTFVKNIYVQKGRVIKHVVDTTNKLVDKFTPVLTHYGATKILSLTNSYKELNDTTMKNELNHDIVLTVTSCKRFDLFEKTINSFLNNCSDVGKITYFFCVDDNSSDEDRDRMSKLYPFFNFYFKNSGEKGHRQSMNIIWNKLNELKPKFYLHLEDDWLFINKRSYVADSISFLERFESDGIHQLLFNKNYAETINDFNLVGGKLVVVDEHDYNIKLHIKDEPNLNGSNCAYWPHFSFRPSVIRTSAVLSLGNFDSPNTFFERDYADKYFHSAGYTSAYFNDVSSIHIGKLTSESQDSKKNAYELNNEEQFFNSGNVNAITERYNKDNKIKVINLVRRRDRRENVIQNFKNVDITNYEIIQAVDGKDLTPTSQIVTLFQGNDFGNRRGVIGCALTHYNLWKQLIESDVDYFLIMEDDFTIIKTFKTDIETINFEKYDILLMGYHMFSKTLEKVKDIYRNCNENEDVNLTIDRLQMDYYIGGIHCYSINKNGARKLVDYIEKHGIKHGIDYLFKIVLELECFETRPHISFAEWNEGGKAIDSDIQNIYDDNLDFTTVPNVPNTVYVSGIGGLGNNLFQLAVAIYYKEANKDKNINIILDGSSELLRHGSGNKFGRSRLKTSYLDRDSILGKFNTSGCIPKCDYNLDNDCFSLNKIDLSNKENSSLLISGYCQNIDLFFSVGEKLLDYFNLDDTSIKKPLLDKYKIDSSAINIMLGIRIGIDGGFKYSKFTKQSYTSVLNTIVNSYDDDDKVINVYVLSDIKEVSFMIQTSDKYNIIYVDEDDVGQLYIGLVCNYFILSDSTFHWWIAFLKWSKDNSTNVYVFNDTDITNRCLLNSNLRKEWKIVDIVPDSDFVFFKNVDCHGNDAFHKHASIPVLMDCAKQNENCIAFNTLGYFKHKIDLNNLVSSPYFKEYDGIYIKREYYEANKDKDDKYDKTDNDNSYIFIEGLDQKDCDLYRRNNMTIEEMKAVADKDLNCACFNTLGFFKSEMSISSLIKSPYFSNKDGLYVKKEHYNKCNSKSIRNDAITLDSIHDSRGTYCFIHSCNLRNNDILDEILGKIKKLQFHAIFIINIGNNIGNKINNVYGENVVIIEYSDNINLYEIPTINILHSFCVRNPESKILYLHTKGVSYQTVPQPVADWRNMMLYFLLDHNCIKLLENYDIVGCNYLENPHPHFSGNFWWTRASYVVKLKPIETTIKHDAEWWIFSDNESNPSYYSLHNSNINHYHELYPLERYKEVDKIRIKMLCNWCSSNDLCNEWSNMCQRGYSWKNIEITWDDRNIDYWVIINKPCDNSYYDPKRTIVFQMEPWVNNESHLWGVKTWGEWSKPDENKFLAVRGRKTKCHNNAFWQLELNYNELVDLKYENENKMDAVSSICSSKYYDEGHIARIDFLKFLETKGGIPLDIFNQDNQHNFKTYRGPLTPYVDKSKGYIPYKYYFMVENNYEENFITEKLWEPILCETLVFYYGCPNVCEYIDAEAFVQLDMHDFEKSYEIIKRAIEEDWWSQRIEAIRREKKKILDELAFFPVIENIIIL
jgi:GR25 family glycosyltransferase involved in LPS biosynthesis